MRVLSHKLKSGCKSGCQGRSLNNSNDNAIMVWYTVARDVPGGKRILINK